MNKQKIEFYKTIVKWVLNKKGSLTMHVETKNFEYIQKDGTIKFYIQNEYDRIVTKSTFLAYYKNIMLNEKRI